MSMKEIEVFECDREDCGVVQSKDKARYGIEVVITPLNDEAREEMGEDPKGMEMEVCKPCKVKIDNTIESKIKKQPRQNVKKGK